MIKAFYLLGKKTMYFVEILKYFSTIICDCCPWDEINIVNVFETIKAIFGKLFLWERGNCPVRAYFL